MKIKKTNFIDEPTIKLKIGDLVGWKYDEIGTQFNPCLICDNLILSLKCICKEWTFRSHEELISYIAGKIKSGIMFVYPSGTKFEIEQD